VGDVKDIVLLDVTPLTLGVETYGGVMTPLIKRNRTIPVHEHQIFTTTADFQPQVEIHVLQGERQMAKDNRSLGRFVLGGLPPAPRNVPQIEVAFDIDVNGILKVAAKDLGTGKSQDITIKASTQLPRDEVDKMVDEAQKHAEEDKKTRDEIDTRNGLEQLIYTVEKSVKDAGDKVSANDKSTVEAAVAKAKETLKGGNIEEIKKETEELRDAAAKVAEALYRQASQNQQAGGPEGGAQGAGEPGGPQGGPQPPKGDVFDAEFKEKGDKEGPKD
jgi:molecular chaperone DnaK